MSVTVDVNVLVDATNAASERHARARSLVEELATGPGIVHLFLPVVTGYCRVVTHRRVFSKPLDFATAVENVRDLADRSHVLVLGGDRSTIHHLAAIGSTQPVSGNLVPDAHIVALMRTHGTRTIWTADRDFRRFDGITVRDPMDA